MLSKKQNLVKKVLSLVLVFSMIISCFTDVGGSITAEATQSFINYDFSNLQGNDSAGAGYARVGNLFKVPNGVFTQLCGMITLSESAIYYDSNTYSLSTTIEAEGGSACKTFTFMDMGFSQLGSLNNFQSISLVFKKSNGDIIDTIEFTNTPSISGSNVTQLSEFNGGTSWNINDVSKIELDCTVTGDYIQFLALENITISNVSNVIPEVATVTTQAVTDSTYNSATGNGNVTNLGAPNPTAYGVCWNTTGNPTTSDSKTNEGAKNTTGAFTTSMTNLSPSTTYYVKAYATNSVGTVYGDQVTFTTSVAPTYTVDFDSDGGSQTPADQTITIGGKATAPVGVTKTGYDLDGWYNGTTKWDFSNDTVTEDVTLKAKWTLHAYDINYHLNGGVNNPSNPATGDYEHSVTFLAPTKVGSVFDGWYLVEDFSFGLVTGITAHTINSEVDIYAKWLLQPQITNIEAPLDNMYLEGDELDFTVTFDAVVNVLGMPASTPYIPLTIGSTQCKAYYVSGTGTNELVFTYEVLLGDNDNNGITVNSPINLNSGSIRNDEGTDASLVFTPPNTSSILVDAKAPDKPDRPELSPGFDLGRFSDDEIINTDSPAFEGMLEPYCEVVLYSDSTEVGREYANEVGSWYMISAPLEDGTHSLTIKAIDEYGHVSEASDALIITIDTSAPEELENLDLKASSDSGYFDDDNITNETELTIEGTAEPFADVVLYSWPNEIGNTIADASGNWSIDTVTLSEGVHAIEAIAKDIAGNESGASEAISVEIDYSVETPFAPSMSASSDLGIFDFDNLTSDNTPQFYGVVEPLSEVILYSGSDEIGRVNADGTGDYSVTSDILPDGEHSIKVKAIDLAGNGSALSGVTTVIIDTDISKPSTPDLISATDTGYSNTDNITSNQSPIFTGVAEPDCSVTLYSGNDENGGSFSDDGGNWSIASDYLSEGTQLITVVTTDMAGNQSVSSDALSVTIDAHIDAPDNLNLLNTSDTGYSNSDDITNDVTPTISGTAEPFSDIVVYSGADEIATATVNADGNWSVTTDTLSEADHSIVAIATDVAGNSSVGSSPLYIMIDTTTPIISDVTDGETYDVAISPTYDDGIGTLKKGTDDATLFFSGSEISENGNYILTVSDEAGNYSEVSFTILIITDPTVPQDFSVIPGNREAVLSFSEPIDNGGADITGYSIKVVRVSDNDTNNYETSTSPYTVTGLENGVEYKFYVAAKNTEKTGDYTPEITKIIGRTGKAIVATAIGEISGNSIIKVLSKTTVDELKAGLVVSEGATVEIITGSGEGAVANQQTTIITEAMKIKVTAENGSTKEYAVSILVPKYNVEFNSNGGTAVASVTNVIEDSLINEPSNPTKEGYTFKGWYKESGLINIWDFDTDIVSEDTILFAKWEIIPQVPEKEIIIIDTPFWIEDESLIEIEEIGEAFNDSVEVVMTYNEEIRANIEKVLRNLIGEQLDKLVIFPLDISIFIKGTDTKVQPAPGTSVRIRVPIPKELLANKDSLKVMCVIDGKVEVLETKIVLVGDVYCVEFVATHFSPYSLVVDKNNILDTINNETDSSEENNNSTTTSTTTATSTTNTNTTTSESAKTGDEMPVVALIMSLMGATMGMVVMRKRKRIRVYVKK